MQNIIRDFANKASIIAAYNPGEYLVTISEQDGQKTNTSLLILITAGENYKAKGIAITEDCRIFLIDRTVIRTLTWQQEFETKANQLQNEVGNMASLKTSVKSNLVDAINELSNYVCSSRKLVGYGKYLLADDIAIGLSPADLDRAFFYKTQRWKYYSQSIDEWTLLPEGWSKLKCIVRMFDDLPKTGEINTYYGVLHDDSVWEWKDGKWIEVEYLAKDEIGDEYVIQNIIVDNKQSSGFLIMTGTGWAFITN